MPPGEIGEGEGGVFDVDDEALDSVERVLDSVALDENTGCALAEDLARKTMCVMVRADDCDEQISGPRLTAIDHGPCKDLVGTAAMQTPTRPLAGPLGGGSGAHSASRSNSARRASSRSSNGNFSCPMIW